MYAFNRGGGGRRQPTPANVQCQKCLKRGHYSYECKANLQERPYKARPSRTQQLLNPKLAPKLTNDAPDDATRKKGVADEELAKKEAERARKRQLEAVDDEDDRAPNVKRQRSSSLDSVSSISTRSSRSPPRGARNVSPPERRPRRRSPSYDSASDRSRRRSLSPEANYPARDGGRSSISPPPRRAPPSRGVREDSADSYRSPPRRRRSPSPVRHEGSTNSYGRHDSRSPVRPDSRDSGRQGQGGYGRYRDRNERGRGEPSRGDKRRAAPPRQPEPPRERSLSPFSKRLALTQAMNMGR